MKVDRFKARELLYSVMNSIGTEQVSVTECFGRVLAEDIFAPRDFPDRRKSAVDGYAHIIGGESYVVIGETGAGRKGAESIKANETVFVMTGGNVPDGADAVTRVEDADVTGDSVKLPVQKSGDNINNIAEENKKGDKLAGKGAVIEKGLYPVLFSVGKHKVEVYKRPKIGIFVTGDETDTLRLKEFMLSPPGFTSV